MGLWSIVGCYVGLHSLSTHKEFRFLLPLLPIFCLLAGHNIAFNLSRVSPRLQRRATTLILASFAILNLGAFVYLGQVHQRAPIDVNGRIRSQVQAEVAHGSRVWTVHYLMGCHSTPAYSHLHVPGVRFDAWHLDCSPSCRASSTIVCESQRFLDDPGAFVRASYQELNPDKSCIAGACAWETPDYIAVYAAEAYEIRAELLALGMEEDARFLQGLNGIAFFGFQLGDDFSLQAFRHFALGWGKLEVSVDEMVLFVNRNSLTSRPA